MPLWYGGDYNPDHWPEDVWADDVTLMNRAGVNLATVGVFSWAKLEPREGEFDFAWLDRVMDGLHAGGVRVDLATATASPPPWLTHRYPEVLPVTVDGVTLHPGSRQQFSPSSPVYRRFATRLVRKLAERYGSHPALEMWHINNEYGCHVSHDYSDVAATAFRGWLEARYGTVEELNDAWGTSFWSQRYSEFAEVYPPRAAPTFKNPAQLLDFDRFSSEQLLACFLAEKEVLREITPDIPITTNFMGLFKGVDYWRFAEHVDVVSDDLYPDPADPQSPAAGAMARDLMRSLKKGTPWILMEQAPSAVNWRGRNAVKKPGQMRAWSWQVVARGADGVLFFQWRQSVSGAEKFHSGMVPHAGTDSRVFREIEQLGAELGSLERIVGSTVTARVAIVFDWDSWWSIEQEATPGDIRYPQHVFAWHREFTRRTIAVDFVRSTEELSGYDLVIVPSLFVATPEALANLAAVPERGGALVVTFQSGITDARGRISRGGYLGELQQTLGVRVEEFAPLASPDPLAIGAPSAVSSISGRISGPVTEWQEFVHADDTEVLSVFDGDLAGWPAVTRRAVGDGSATYVATWPDDAGIAAVLDTVLAGTSIRGELEQPIDGVEVIRRGELLFVINHSAAPVTVPLAGVDLLTGVEHPESVVLESQGVAILTGERVR